MLEYKMLEYKMLEYKMREYKMLEYKKFEYKKEEHTLILKYETKYLKLRGFNKQNIVLLTVFCKTYC
jgi:hypothetical protein